ncbi:MAG: hypothetical protein ACRDWI_08600 [Jiangellaceae bacterium]
MLPHPDQTLSMYNGDHAELLHAAEQDRAAIHVRRAQRMERWAQRAARLSAFLTRHARLQRARLS